MSIVKSVEAELKTAGVRWIDYAEWHRIKAVEEESAVELAPRRKLVTVDEMLAVLGG